MHRFTKINNELCVQVKALAEAMGIDIDNAVNTVKRGMIRYRQGASDNWRYYTDESDARRNWIVVKALPDVTRLRLEHVYGDLERAYTLEVLPDMALLKVQPGDKEFFLSMAYADAKAGDLARACGWLRLTVSDDWRESWGGKMASLKLAAMAISEQQLYGFRISNWRVLNRRCEMWKEGGRESLMHGQRGNQNAGKAPEDLQKVIHRRIVDLYASPLKPDAETVADVYNREAAERGWPQYTGERIRQILMKPDNKQIWQPARHGVNAARGLSEHIIKRRRPSYPDAMWSIDGTTLQLYSTESGKLLKEHYVVFVTDAMSDCVIGWGLGATETMQVVQRAMRMAIARSNRRPAYTQFDGSQANLSKEVKNLMTGLSTVGIKSQPYNGKSKYVERIIGVLEQHVIRYFRNFVGGNVTARSLRARANPDALKQLLIETRITGEQLISQLALAVEVLNNTANSKGVTPAELYAKSDDRRKSIGYLEQVSLFWIKREKLYTYTPEGLRMEVGGERLFYEVTDRPGIEDMHFREAHLGDKFLVRYNPDDLNAINLYDRNDQWVATATQKHEYGATPEDWMEGEGSALHQLWQNRKAYIRKGLDERNAIREEMAEMGAEELSFELVHKDALNRLETETALRLLNDAGMSAEKEPMRRQRKPLYFDEQLSNNLLKSEE